MSADSLFQDIQNKYNAIRINAEHMAQLLTVMQNNDLHHFIKLLLSNIQKQMVVLEDKFAALLLENGTLKYEINHLKQQLHKDVIRDEKCDTKCTERELIDSNDVQIVDDIDYDSLELADDGWAHKIFSLFRSNNIHYTLLKHEAVFTCKQASKFDHQLNGANCKNLFLQDKKKKNYFILSALEQTQFKINHLKKKIMTQHQQIKCGSLQFGYEETLNSRLKLIKGSVTPFGILNDESKQTVLLIDENLTKHEYVKFHPLVNTMTVSVKLNDFISLVQKLGYTFYVVKLD
eukprot:195947_1